MTTTEAPAATVSDPVQENQPLNIAAGTPNSWVHKEQEELFALNTEQMRELIKRLTSGLGNGAGERRAADDGIGMRTAREYMAELRRNKQR